MRAIFIGFAFAVAVLPPRSAYGDEGHEITALIAWKHLDPGVQATVKQMLAADPDDLTAPEVASAATWADKFRDSDRNTTKIRYTLTREWHFVDLEIDHPDMAAACLAILLPKCRLVRNRPRRVWSTASPPSGRNCRACRRAFPNVSLPSSSCSISWAICTNRCMRRIMRIGEATR